jgi:uncharacterized membrane protein YfcA
MEWWAAYLGLGVFVGFFAGLFGIGGGLTIVPVLAIIFQARGFPPDAILHLALGTAMASIIFTGSSSVRAHHVRGAVDWRIVRYMAPGVIGGTFVGALLVGFFSTRVLTVLFTVIAYLLAARMFIGGRPAPARALPGRAVVAAFGAGVGVLSSLAALGGAGLIIPFLARCNVRMQSAVGTAAAIGVPLAVSGTIGYIVSGWSHGDLPPYSLGYVYLPALGWLVVATMAVAPLGAWVAHHVRGETLRRGFSLLLFAIATKLLVSLF